MIQVTERELSGEQMNLAEMMRQLDSEIQRATKSLTVDETFEWNGKPLQPTGDAEVVMAEGSLTASILIDEVLKSWMLVRSGDQGDGYVVYRILKGENGEFILQELESPNQSDISGKYERDQLLGVLQGCQKYRHGEDGLPSF